MTYQKAGGCKWLRVPEPLIIKASGTYAYKKHSKNIYLFTCCFITCAKPPRRVRRRIHLSFCCTMPETGNATLPGEHDIYYINGRKPFTVSSSGFTCYFFLLPHKTLTGGAAPAPGQSTLPLSWKSVGGIHVSRGAAHLDAVTSDTPKCIYSGILSPKSTRRIYVLC